MQQTEKEALSYSLFDVILSDISFFVMWYTDMMPCQRF